MQDIIQGVFHFHSSYSHDGRSTLHQVASDLMRRGFSFCIMTEHFEDFNAEKFGRYLREANAVSQSTGFLLIPGAEVALAGLHTIIFPVRDFAEISAMRWADDEADPKVFKVLAHPSKYPFEGVRDHLQRYKINGLELWNQEADSRYIPSLAFLARLGNERENGQRRYFFGCDLHSANLTIANTIRLVAPCERTTESIVTALLKGDFVTRNIVTGIEYDNRWEDGSLHAWVQATLDRKNYRGLLRKGARRCLRSLYKMLSPKAQHSLNDIKNFVRNKI